MARRELSDVFLKKQRRSKKFFVTSSNALENHKITATTISSSDFNKFSDSFARGEHLLDVNIRESTKPILYMLQQLEEDVEDMYNELSASTFEGLVIGSYWIHMILLSGFLIAIPASKHMHLVTALPKALTLCSKTSPAIAIGYLLIPSMRSSF